MNGLFGGNGVNRLLGGGRFGFERPGWLLLGLAVPLLFAMLRLSLADFPRWQLALQAGLRTLVLAGIAVALAGPMLRRATREVSVVALVDVSDSISDDALGFERAAVSSIARAAVARGDPAPRVVRFAARPEELRTGPDAPAQIVRLPEPEGAATNVALGVALGAGLVDVARLPRLLLMSDGRPTRGDVLTTAGRLADRGLPIFALLLPPPSSGDTAVAALGAPEDVRTRVPFQVDVRLSAERPTHARVRLEGEGAVTIDEPERAVTLPRGSTTVGFTVRITEPGTARFRAHVTADDDRRPENDEGVLAIATERDPRVLCLEGSPGSAAAFAHALGAVHIAADVRSGRVPPGAFDFRRYDLVVLADVPRGMLPDPTLASLDAFVREGGGLFVAGGTQSFGPGGYAGTRLAEMLPVRLEVPDEREEASLALGLVIDKSGSMSGAKMDLTKEAARATAETLPPSDQIAVVVFDSVATPVVRLQRAANRQRILSDISRIQASGGTNIFAGLREAVDELLPVRARKKHIILLSDGQSPYEEIPDLVDGAAAARITVSAVGVGDGADQTLLKMIAARGGGRFYHTLDPASIPRIFSHETSELGDQSIVNAPTKVRIIKPIAALAGVPLETAPALSGYVMTQRRQQAELILSTTDGAPLLTRWQLGLGQVLAFTSDLGARWSSAWTRWPPADKLWSQLARATMRRRAATHFPIRSTRNGDLVQLAVDAIGADDRFLVGLDGTVEVTGVGPGGRAVPPRTLPLAEIVPGRYEATFVPDLDTGSLLFQAILRSHGAAVADATGRLALPFAPELQPDIGPDGGAAQGASLLAAVAAETGGRVITDPLEVLDPGPGHRETRQPLRTPVLLVTLALYLLDVFVRRVRLRPGPVDPAKTPGRGEGRSGH